MATFRSRAYFGGGSEPTDIFRPYNPVKLVYSSRISEHQWEEVRPMLEHLHREGRTREQMLKSLAQHYDFHPSLYQLNSRMVAWGYKVQKRSAHIDLLKEHVESQPSTAQYAPQTSSQDARPTDEYDSNAFDVDTPMEDSSSQTSTAYPTEILKKGLSSVFQSTEGLHAAKRLCVMHEIVQILFRADWCSTHSIVLIKHLSDTMDDNDSLLVKEARLLLYREYLQWLVATKDPQTINWILQRLEQLTVGAECVSHARLLSGLRICHSMREMLISPDVGAEVLESEDFVQNLSALQAYLDSHVIKHRVLSAYAKSLIIEPGFPNLFSSFSVDESLARLLLSWSIRQINVLEPASILASIEKGSCNDRVVLSFYTGLTRFWITKWIDYTQAVAGNTTCSTSDEIPAFSDLHLFKSIAQTLALLSYFTVELTKNFLVTIPHGLENDKDADLSQRMINLFKSALRELESTLENKVNYVIDPNAGFVHGNYMEDNVETSTRELLGHVISTAMESFYLRQNPDSRRHQSALDQLPDQLSAMRHSACLNGPDAMVSRHSSSSSIRSFRRAGIKLKDLHGPPSLMSLSSQYTCGSSIGNIPELE